jgi:hypothetical protein
MTEPDPDSRKPPPRLTPQEAAEWREWAAEMRRLGEAGLLKDDIPYLKRRLAEEKRRQQRG